MEIIDRVYGTFDVNDKVLVELINSRPLQRLKGINQAGASKFAIPGKDVTRYEHSLGVMLLLRIVGAGLKEQIAGLLHDVPHTAFSHVIDFVFESEAHEFHERFHEKLISQSEIPGILNAYSFDIKYILDEENFPLLEKQIPDLCADRIDYTLRDITASFGFTPLNMEYVNNLVINHNELVFGSFDLAKKFALDYLFMDKEKWCHPKEVALYKVLADAIKMGFNEHVLSVEDLFMDDDFVYGKLKGSGNVLIGEKLQMLNPKFGIRLDKKDYDFHSMSKLRYVDPKYVSRTGEIKRVSESYPELSNMIQEHKKRYKEGFYIKITDW